MLFKKAQKFSWKRVVVIGVVLTVLLRLFVFEKFYIYSVSMSPTIQHKDWVWVTKFDYGYSRKSFPFRLPESWSGRWLSHLPERGDIAVFRSSKNWEKWPYVKRVVGLPGDKIALRDGKLFINDEEVLREADGGWEAEDNKGRLHVYYQYIETLPNGVRHKIIEIDDKHRFDNFEEVTVPDGYLFFMGDNRDESEDSRGDLGFIPFENVIGKVRGRN